MKLTPKFEPQRGEYTAEVDTTYYLDKSGWIEYTSREGQTVSISLDASGTATDAELQTNNTTGLKRIVYGEEGETDENGNVVGTIVLKVTVSESGFTSTVYTVTITRTLHVLTLESLSVGSSDVDIDFDYSSNLGMYVGHFKLSRSAELTGQTLTAAANKSGAVITIQEGLNGTPVTLPCVMDIKEPTAQGTTDYLITVRNDGVDPPTEYFGSFNRIL